MDLSSLSPNAGATTNGSRVGRGHGSGNGKTSGRGQKGQKSRSGGGTRLGFEGGQMPLYRRIPKRGFKNRNKLDFVGINVSALNCFEDGAEVNVFELINLGLVKNPRDGIKILGDGELTKKLNVKGCLFTETAKEKIEAAGGTCEVI